MRGNPWTPSSYPNYDDEDRTAMMNQQGGELMRKYNVAPGASSRQALAQVAPKLEAAHGLPSGWTLIKGDGKIPPWVYPSYPQDALNSLAGITLAPGKDYPASSKYRAVVVVDPSLATRPALSNLDHELNHVQDAKEGTSVDDPFQYSNSDDNSGRHFGADQPGQMFNYEGRQALQMMLQRFNSINANPWTQK